MVQVEKVVKLPTFYAEDTAASANEVWSRLHSDPLFAVSDSSPPVHSMPSSFINWGHCRHATFR